MSPYGISKVAGFELTRNYREAYGLYCAGGMLFCLQLLKAHASVSR
jgi:GDP-D-mannose dehydratase